ncbi:MAG: hypothetical protein RRB13_07600 [bacterium]|nr:hypothetical protein [bacterium]
MHQYIESVRSETEAASGPESYLAGALFMRLQQAFEYEDDGENRLESRDGYELVQHKAINCLKGRHEFKIADEVLSWQASLLRHVTHELYDWWIQYKNDKFQAPSFFADGQGCMAIEAACEKIGLNPTEEFTQVLEVEHLLVKLTTGPNKMLLELKRFWEFKWSNKEAKTSPFTAKRIEAERSHVTLAKIAKVLDDIADRFAGHARRQAGGHHLMWINAATELRALTALLKGFLDFEHHENLESSLSQWIDGLFPNRLADGTPNPLFQSELHHEVVQKMTQATQVLVNFLLRKDDSFTRRDEIMVPFVLEKLEAIKRTCLTFLPQAEVGEQAGTRI